MSLDRSERTRDLWKCTLEFMDTRGEANSPQRTSDLNCQAAQSTNPTRGPALHLPRPPPPLPCILHYAAPLFEVAVDLHPAPHLEPYFKAELRLEACSSE